jgi:hypothetical protein
LGKRAQAKHQPRNVVVDGDDDRNVHQQQR